MSKKIWSIEEEKFVCKAYLKELVCSNDYARYVGHEMVEAGFEERSVSSIVAKLNDYRKIHNRLDLSHVAPKSIRVYSELYVRENLNVENISGFINSINNNTEAETLLTINNISNSRLTNLITVPGLPQATRANTDYRMLFAKYLNQLMVERNLKAPMIYNPVGMSRKTFDKLKNGESISKENLLRIAFSLKMSLEETAEFLSIVNISLNIKLRFDQVIVYFLKEKIHDPFEVNETLYHYGLDLLFF